MERVDVGGGLITIWADTNTWAGMYVDFVTTGFGAVVVMISLIWLVISVIGAMLPRRRGDRRDVA